MATDILIVVAAIGLSIVLLHPRLSRSRSWRATITPLASIIGSGFLIAGPILAESAGQQAWLAMTALCAIAYVFGSAIRFNIRHVEPALQSGPTLLTRSLQRIGIFTLAIAYFISVAYYLNLFAAFGLRMANITDPFLIRCAATAVIGVLGAIGGIGGLHELERLEVYTVGVKLGLIGAIMLALIASSIGAFAGGTFSWPALEHPQGGDELSIILGLVILVQGFETSRYLGAEYTPEMRIRTMRWAQWLSSAIYIGFILLTTRFFTTDIPSAGGETAIIDILAPLGAAIAPIIILAALASQSSAAIADTNGAGGLLAEGSNKRISVRIGNIATAAAAIGITWAANIYEIIVYASKAFVLYYAIQCLQATAAAVRARKWGHAALFGAALVLAAGIVIFAAPADA